MPLVMKRIAVDAVKKAMREEDLELVRERYELYGRDWLHHLVDTSPEEREMMNALLPEDKKDESAWPTTLSGHHGFGTQIRNVLRSDEGAGIKDEDLPDAPYEGGGSHRNWDDRRQAAVARL